MNLKQPLVPKHTLKFKKYPTFWTCIFHRNFKLRNLKRGSNIT